MTFKKKKIQMKIVLSPDCTFCNSNMIGTFIHMMWECPLVKKFWEEASKSLSELLHVSIECSPRLMLSNDDSSLDLYLSCRQLIFAALIASKKMLGTRWLPPHSLSIQQLHQSMIGILMLELSTARMNQASQSVQKH